MTDTHTETTQDDTELRSEAIPVASMDVAPELFVSEVSGSNQTGGSSR
ncbi:hypothetical protein [Haloquadratum walsbyi]|nr:hypothetical protein [Haloquadratum walsbyi]